MQDFSDAPTKVAEVQAQRQPKISKPLSPPWYVKRVKPEPKDISTWASRSDKPMPHDCTADADPGVF